MLTDEECLALAAAAYIILSEKKNKKRKYWVRPSLRERNQYGGLQLLNALKKDDLLSDHITDGHVQNFTRISSSDLEWLLSRIEPIISKSDTNYRTAISAIERLLLTLRFLATGDSYHSLMYLFRISTQSISNIVPAVCEGIVQVLSDQIKCARSAELVIQIPENLSQDNSTYRLDYWPPHGSPQPNTTIPSRDIGHVIQFSRGLPGTKYEFSLYYSNSTHKDWLTWTASITTAPDPPSNLTVTVKNGKSALINFSPPTKGSFSSFKIKLLSLAESKPTRTINLESASPYVLKDLTPGGTYQVQLFTVYDNKESVAYTSKNFTTKPNTPGKFIVWFRNETTLLVLWQPSIPSSIYSHYKVTIEPEDALESSLYVEKEGEPPGPAQAAFKALVPGRAYNISVQTVSEDETSAPTIAQYRTIPLRPINLQVDPASVTSHSFTVTWAPPNGTSEYDKYQISINLRRPSPVTPLTRNRTEPTRQTFNEGLEPGLTYQVAVKTVSGKVTSWPATVNVTLKPLPVRDLKAVLHAVTGDVMLSWRPDNSSYQEHYEISYTEVYKGNVLNGDTNSMETTNTEFLLDTLLPGRNYSITVQAVSNQIRSDPVSTFQATRPSAPVIEDLKPIEYGLNISWKSDVNSRQEKYEVIHKRNDTGSEPIITVTTEPQLLIKHLYPGAGYHIKVFAISHGLYSEPHDYFQAVYPKPPRNLTMENVTSNSVVVRWAEPIDSLFSEFSIRYRTEEEPRWYKLASVKGTTEAEVGDLTPGERYTIQVNSVSFGVESARPLALNHTVRPNPVTNIAPLVDSTNVTLEFPRPEGRIEYYVINWVALDGGDDKMETKSRNMSGIGTKGGTVRALVEDLMPGVKYQFDIHTVSYGLHSYTTNLAARTMPLILSELVVVSNLQATNTMTIRYTPTPLASSHFDKYRFTLSEPGLVREKDANDTEWKVTFTDLTPGKLYNITVWTVADKVLSQPLNRQDRLYPEPITTINATQITDTAITLVWDKPKGEYNAFEVQYLNTDGLLIQNLTQEETITINELKPHRNYTFTVIVRSGMEATVLRRSLPVSAVFTTQESVPGMVNKFHPTDIRPREISFEWSLPGNEQNGVIRKFSITYNLEGSTQTKTKDFSSLEFNGSIRGLLPGKTYTFRIQAETKVGYGPEAVWKEKMPILAPPKPSSQVVPTEVCRTSSTIQIRFRKNYFSDDNGPITAYTIIVAEDDTKNASGIEMPSWRDVQAYGVWPPYQVLEPYYPFKNSTVEDFTIGVEDCEKKSVGYCNGPLKGGTTYKVKIRAFTTPDKFTDTSYSFSIQTDQDTTPLILGVTISSAIILILFIGILLLRRHKLLGRRMADNRAADNLSLPDSIIETSRPIRLDQFAEHYRLMSADSDFRFSEEFEELKHVGREQPCTFADLPCNRPKNRFTNILPYDHSRFKLQPVDDEEGSDYINANYVPGFNSPREFIVTQGPLHSTKEDFWRMCWESNSRAIVMLTRCIEKGREKCDHYWPYDTMPVYYGDISVTMLNDSHYPDWCITEFIMQRGDTQRVIRHFHFTTWPDFGVPNPPTTLIMFVRAFRERISPEQRPIVVHCSAGVGRSGTFIALDRILQSLNHGADHVDIFGIVCQMRKERVWMVQTEQQYICIHQCLLAVLQGTDNQSPLREIHHNQGFEDDEGIAESGM